jgi:hypothetical protein
MRRRLLAATTVGAAVAVLAACGDMHPGAAVVINDGDYRVSMAEIDDLTAALCDATPLISEAQGQPGQLSEGIEARQYVTGLMIQSYLSPLAGAEAGAGAPTPNQTAVTPDDHADITDQMDEESADDFVRLLEIGTEVAAWQSAIGAGLPNANPSNATQLGQQYVFDFAGDFDIDVDPRLGLDGDDLQAQPPSRSGSLSVAQSSLATSRDDETQRADVAEALPPTQTCG